MSGYKRATVTIGQEEYDRLREAEVRLRTLPEISAQTNQQIHQQIVETIECNTAGLAERQRQYEYMLANMDDQVRDFENLTLQALREHETQTQTEIEQYAGSLWAHFDQMLAQQAEQFEAQVFEVHRQNQQELAVVSRRLRKMAGNAERKREIASGWLCAAQELAAFIDDQYDAERFYPGRFDRLAMQLEQTRLNMEIGLAEAVVVASQQLYAAFSDLRLDLERAEQEWRLLYHAAQEAVQQLLALVIESQQVEAVDLDGQPLPFLVDLLYWMPGRLERLYENLVQRAADLAAQPGAFETERLREWLLNELPELHQALQAAVLEGRIRALNSQLRINIADLVVRALQDQGFRLSEAEYATEDMRQAFDARLVNLEGNEVLVTVAPTGEALGDNELKLESLDVEDRTEHELQQRWHEISRSLQFYGLEVGNLVTQDTGLPTPQGRRGPSPAVQPQKTSRQQRGTVTQSYGN